MRKNDSLLFAIAGSLIAAMLIIGGTTLYIGIGKPSPALLPAPLVSASVVVEPDLAYEADPVSVEPVRLDRSLQQVDLRPLMRKVVSLIPPAEDFLPVVENTGVFELPVAGTHGIAMIVLKVRDDSGAAVDTVSAGTPFTILKENDTKVLARFADGLTGWVDKNYIMVNLPDLIPSIIYKNSNAEASLFRSLGIEINGITGKTLYESKVYNEKLGREEFIMPVQYHTAKKIMEAQQIAKEQDLTIVLYEGFRPFSAQMEVVSAMTALANKDLAVRAAISKNGFSKDFYICTGVSNHQQGAAVDVSLAQVSKWADTYFNGNTVSVPEAYEEFRYGEVIADALDGIRFGSRSFGIVLPEDTANWMPTPMHELSYLAGTFTRPTKTYTHGAWKTALENGSVKRAAYWTAGAQKLQDIFVAAGMDPLASEWWHFNDIPSRNTAKSAGVAGKFEVGTDSFSMSPADAVALVP